MSRSLRSTVISELARAAGGGPSHRMSVWHSGDRLEWESTLAWLDLSGLAIYFYQALQARGAAEALPDYVRNHLNTRFEHNRLRVAALAKEFKTLNSWFEGSGVDYAVLKGFALVPDYCRDPAFRTQYDHDYLVQPSSLRRAEAALRSAGYVLKQATGDHPMVYFRPQARGNLPPRPAGLYAAGLPRDVELHFRCWDPAEENIDLQVPNGFWERIRRRSCQGSAYRTLSDVDTLLFQVLHAFRHVLRNWCRLSTFLEIAHFLERRSSDSEFWLGYCGRIEGSPWCAEASFVVLSLSAKLFGAPTPAEIRSLTPTRFSAVANLWIERYGQKAAVSNFLNSKSSLFLHREFVTAGAAWRQIRRRRLFPLRRPHRLPEALCQPANGVFRQRWSRCLHVLQRLKFHGYSLLSYAWESPQWRLRRSLLLRQLPRNIQAESVSGSGASSFLLSCLDKKGATQNYLDL